MRILVLSNFYPPYHIGGYELGCRDVVEQLRQRGHEIAVLTSSYQANQRNESEKVFRWLKVDLRSDTRRPARALHKVLGREFHNISVFRRLVEVFEPDIVYAWNMHRISVSLLFLAQQQKLPIACYVSDDWLARWNEQDMLFRSWGHPADNHLNKLIRSLTIHLLSLHDIDLVPGNLHIGSVQFTSEFMRRYSQQALTSIDSTEVIHWGIDVERFSPPSRRPADHYHLLYVGQLFPHKGVHTVIEALASLKRTFENETVTLSIVGGSTHASYRKQLKKLVQAYDLSDEVVFTGQLSRTELPVIYRNHDILIFASIWEEPFSITLLEAMASGMAIVSTLTGGTAEVVESGVNALVFPPGDAAECADQIRRLMTLPNLAEKIQQNARATVVKNFQLCMTVDKIEEDLVQLLDRASE